MISAYTSHYDEFQQFKKASHPGDYMMKRNLFEWIIQKASKDMSVEDVVQQRSKVHNRNNATQKRTDRINIYFKVLDICRQIFPVRS